MTTIPAVRTIARTGYPAAGRWTIDPGHAETVTIETASLTTGITVDVTTGAVTGNLTIKGVTQAVTLIRDRP